MCGIVGAVSSAPIEPRIIEQMRDRLAHRGPDSAGTWLADNARVCLGHRRLAIVDLTPEANQPLVSHDGRFVIVFNGEIYNFQSLREELLKLGAVFRTRSDTEVLMEAFRYWNHQCLPRLSGMFAFAIWDTQERRLFCARDRLGEKPFYYTTVQGSFLFASEVKALAGWPAFPRTIHYPALIDYLSFGFVADPKSIWEGCYKLLPGHWMSVDMHDGKPPRVNFPVPYWDMEFDPDYSVLDWGPTIREALRSTSKEMAFADVPVGAFLSGGVDSSSVTAALSKAGCAVNTFTVGFQEEEYDERGWAQEVSRLYHTSHTEKVVTAEDVEPVFQKLLWHYDEPFNDYSYLPTFYLCREARRNITVALSGDGGDELFAGYLKYRRLGMREGIHKFVPAPLVKLTARTANQLLAETNPLRRKFAHYGLKTPDLLVDMFSTGVSLPALQAAARGPLAEALKHYTPADAVLPLLRKAPPQEVGLINCMRYLDLKLTLAGDILVKIDRASMAVSLEVRPVYLHRDMIALAGRIPANCLVDRNETKKALKAALQPWLPDSILYRKKQGFAMPLKNWINGDLGPLFTPNHSADPLEDLLDRAAMERTKLTHFGREAAVIHSLVFLKHWLAKWMENDSKQENEIRSGRSYGWNGEHDTIH